LETTIITLNHKYSDSSKLKHIIKFPLVLEKTITEWNNFIIFSILKKRNIYSIKKIINKPTTDSKFMLIKREQFYDSFHVGMP